MYGTPVQKIFINPPTESQMLFLSDGNTVVIKTQKSLTSWNLYSSGKFKQIRSKYKQNTVLSFLAKSYAQPRQHIKKQRHCFTEVHLVKAMIFPVVIHGFESWTIKKAEC